MLFGVAIALVLAGASSWVGTPATAAGQGRPARPDVPIPPRLNKLIPILESGKPVFGSSVPVGSRAQAKQAANAGWDFLWFEMEHSGFTPMELEDSMQYLLDRRQIVAQGSIAPATVPLVRVPPNGREMNQWIIKHVLDQGVYGILFPHINTVEEARNAVVFSRYAQAVGSLDMEPAGHRGVSPGNAQRWWGISDYKEYHRRADVWPLDPEGEIMVWIMIEEPEGAKNLADILRQVKVSGVIAAEVDMSTAMGIPGGRFSPEVEQVMKGIADTCKQFKVPVGSLATRDNIEQRIRDGFQFLITGDAVAIDKGRKLAATMAKSH